MLINILKIIVIIIVAIGSSILLNMFFNKCKAKELLALEKNDEANIGFTKQPKNKTWQKIFTAKIFKYVLTAFIFSAIAVGCNFLQFSTDSYTIILSDIVIAVGGLTLGGYVALSSCIVCSLERFFSVYYGTMAELQIALLVSYLFTGAFVFVFRSVVIRHKRIKWYYGVVVGLVIAVFYLLMIFLTNTNDLVSAYQIVSNMTLPSLIIKPLSILIALFVIALITSKKTFNIEKPLHIQSITGLTLAMAIIIGFTSIMGITYKVLDNNSKESTLSTINISLTDIKDNIISDVNSDYISKLQSAMLLMKQNALQKELTEEEIITLGYPSLEYYNELQERHLSTISSGRGFTDLALIRHDGTIKYTTNAYIKSLNNISELNIIQHDSYKSISTVEDYKYITQLNAYLKCVYCNYYYSAQTSDYYVLAIFNEEQYKSQINTSIEKGLASRHLGENGFVVVTDSEKNVLSTPIEIGETFDININNLNALSEYSLNNTEYYAYVEDFIGIKIIALMDKGDCDLNMNISLYITALTEVLVFFILYCIIYFADTKTVIKPLKRVNRTLGKIIKGNLNEKVNEYSNNEFKVLSEDINSTVDALKDYMGREAKKMQQDLEFAKQIQHSAIPSTFPPFPTYTEFDIYASMNTAKEVGGDFYDFYLVDDRHLCVLIADVSGKGIPASLFMMQSKTIIKSLIESKKPIDEAITLANQKLCENNSAQMFVTAWCGVLDLDTGLLKFVNAGHNPPLLKHNGMFNYLKTKVNFVLAGFDSSKYVVQEVVLDKGDELFLYTDGITEAKSNSEQFYGEERLFISANKIKAKSSREMCEQILKDVKEYTLDAEQSDDITMLNLKFFGK